MSVHTTDQTIHSGLEIEAAPSDITITVDGPRRLIAAVDTEQPAAEPGALTLYTSRSGETIRLPALYAAVTVAADLTVQHVTRVSSRRTEATTLIHLPAGGIVLAACCPETTDEGERYLETCFKPGDRIKLRRLGELIGIRELTASDQPSLVLNHATMFTSLERRTWISGRIANFQAGTDAKLLADETAGPVMTDGTFSAACDLRPGTNYISLRLISGGQTLDRRQLVVFCRAGLDRLNPPGTTPQTSEPSPPSAHTGAEEEVESPCSQLKDHPRRDREVILWVDQGANSRRFQTAGDVASFLKQARASGVTMVVLDVLGVEGFVTYQKTTLTGRPHASRIRAPKKAGAHPELDLLGLFVHYGHELGLKIHASINVFAEGSILYDAYAVLDDHPDWEERVRHPGDGATIKRQRESAAPGVVAFVNPAHDEAREYQLKTFEEIMMNYEVDGIVHDRSRYDNEAADFSETSRVAFEDFLAKRGKTMRCWPADIYEYAAETRIDGPLLQDWWEFRAAVIRDFLLEVKELAAARSLVTGRRIEVSAYVGSWYESYYVHGANWCSPRFQHDDRLELTPGSLYTPAYIATGYTDSLDFLMIGAYQQTVGEIEKYITQAQIVTAGELPIYTGLAVANVTEAGVMRDACAAALTYSDGLMLFDASHIEDWPALAAALPHG
ncbi:hypothetical protein [Paenibacillus sp. 1P07SE]|uniref:hypothetical protein n=1 Tax=Paenibacillus sp. 1P07SE TaxID=3132209 RepID=UPI0039A657CD